jgi:hypothetical protein
MAKVLFALKIQSAPSYYRTPGETTPAAKGAGEGTPAAAMRRLLKFLTARNPDNFAEYLHIFLINIDYLEHSSRMACKPVSGIPYSHNINHFNFNSLFYVY